MHASHVPARFVVPRISRFRWGYGPGSRSPGCLGPAGHRARIELGTAAFGLGLSPDEAVLYVTLPGAGKMAVIDQRTLRVNVILTTGGRPRRVAFDVSGAVALVANEAGWVDLVR
jgi:YVTN family beta-propeller protein